jgi:vancomycin permeability regulator SanA
MKKGWLISFYFLVAWFLAHTLFIAIDGLTDEVKKADCILILGNTVNEDGSLSPRLQSRVDEGLELYRQGLGRKILVSGGLGKEGYFEGTEMKKYLLGRGVKDGDVIVDNEGNTTLATALNFQRISTKQHWKSVIIVSQFYHITRTKLIVNKTGIYQVYSAHSNYFELRDLYSLCREYAAFYRYLLA